MSKALAQFKEYVANVYVGRPLHSDQLLQLERAFMAGCLDMFQRMDGLADMPMEQALAELKAARVELREYCESVAHEPPRALREISVFSQPNPTKSGPN